MKNRIFLSPPHINKEVEPCLAEVFSSNYIAPVGSSLDGFETDIAKKVNCLSAAALNSGTSAIHLALVLLKIGKGDSVIIQTNTHIGSVNPILYQGASPVFVDSEKGSWNMSPQFLLEAIKDQISKGRKPKAIIIVHLYGMPAKMEDLMAISNKYDIPIIEDAAESLGSTYQNKQTGTFGIMGIYSFNGNKIITTGGGGVLVSNSKKIIDKAKFLATQARDNTVHYQHSFIGYNYRMSNVLAGIGRGQIHVLEDRVAKRRLNFDRYRKYFEKWNQLGLKIQFQEEQENMFSNRWLTTILLNPNLNNGISKEKIRLALEKEDIESRPLWKPMHLQPLFKNSEFYGKEVAKDLFEMGLCLPSGSNLGDFEFERIFQVLNRILQDSLP